MGNTPIHDWFVNFASTLANAAGKLGSNIQNGLSSVVTGLGNSGFNNSAAMWGQDFMKMLDQFGTNWANSSLDAQREARDWTAQREDSEVQRRVADLQAAGLNPWLALNGGSLGSTSTSAATAGDSSASGQMQLAQFTLGVINAMSSAYQRILNTNSNIIGNILKAVL